MNMLFGLKNQFNNSDFEDDDVHPLNEYYIQGFRGSKTNSPYRRSNNNSNENQQSTKGSMMSSDNENQNCDNQEDFHFLTGHTSGNWQMIS